MPVVVHTLAVQLTLEVNTLTVQYVLFGSFLLHHGNIVSPVK